MAKVEHKDDHHGLAHVASIRLRQPRHGRQRRYVAGGSCLLGIGPAPWGTQLHRPLVEGMHEDVVLMGG